MVVPSYGSKVPGRQKPSDRGTTIINLEKGWLEEHKDVKDEGIGAWVA